VRALRARIQSICLPIDEERRISIAASRNAVLDICSIRTGQ
jgi:hypothetical protein